MSAGASAPRAEWAVLAYIVGTGNVAGYAQEYWERMMAARRSDDVHLVVHIRRPDPQGTTRYHVRGAQSEVLPVPSNPNMGLGTTLSDFVGWALSTYPARHTLLVVWSHGTGVEDPAEGHEEALVLDGPDYLDTVQLRDALRAGLGGLPPGAGRLDVLGFDACLMSMVEIAHEMRDRAQFFIASETEEPARSWPWGTILASLAAQPRMEAEALARGIVAAYRESFADPATIEATLAAVALAKMEALRDAVDALAGALLENLSAAAGALDDRRARLAIQMDVPDYVDLGGLLDRLAAAECLEPTVQRVRDALHAATVDAVAEGQQARGMCGLSIYFPADPSAPRFPRYGALDFAATRWPAFLEAYAAAAR